MVFDKLQNCERYAVLHPDFEVAFARARELFEKNAENGTYEIRGKSVYANVSTYPTKQEGLYEAHDRYIDIQIMLSGEEEIYVLDRAGLEEVEPYNVEKDYALYQSAQKSTVAYLRPGDFCILYPNDAHKPCIAPDGKIGESKKIVVKVAL